MTKDTFEELLYKKYETCKKMAFQNVSKMLIQSRKPLMILEQDVFLPDQDIDFNFHILMQKEHCHDFFEIIYVYKSEVLHTIDGKKSVLSEKDICIINPYLQHYLYKTNDTDIVINILIKTSFLDSVLTQLAFSNDIILRFFSDCMRNASDTESMIFAADDLMDTSAHAYLDFLLGELIEKKDNYMKSVNHLMILFFLELSRTYWKHQEKFGMNPNKTEINELLEYIYEHYQSITLEEMAKHFHYHPTYLPQLLKKQTGKTFSQILQQIRMTIAKDKLLNTSKTIYQISEEVGYSSVSAFYTAFTKVHKQSPSSFRDVSK